MDYVYRPPLPSRGSPPWPSFLSASAGGGPKALAMAIAATAAMSGSAAVARPLADAIHGTSVLSPSPATARALVAALHGTSALTFSNTNPKPLSLAVHGTASVTFSSMAVARALTLAAHGSSALVDALSVTRPLSFSVGGISHLVAAISGKQLAMTIVGTSVMHAAATMNKGFRAAIVGTAPMAASFTATRPLVAAMHGTSALTFTRAAPPGSTVIVYGVVRGGTGSANALLAFNGTFWVPAAQLPMGAPGTAMTAWSTEGQTIAISVPIARTTLVVYGLVRGSSGASGAALAYAGAYWVAAAQLPGGTPGTALQPWTDGQTIAIAVTA